MGTDAECIPTQVVCSFGLSASLENAQQPTTAYYKTHFLIPDILVDTCRLQKTLLDAPPSVAGATGQLAVSRQASGAASGGVVAALASDGRRSPLAAATPFFETFVSQRPMPRPRQERRARVKTVIFTQRERLALLVMEPRVQR